MGLTLGKFMAILAIVYTVLATPWYIPRSVYPLVAGIPAWALATVIIILILGYIIYALSGKVEEMVRSGG
ncbi:MAG: hypothetical protein B6U73_01690 [Desulfurococcales archaeon ex4484_204]|nr:MAG: hypothetical protein B6U73_01690 [Desulfurococcales archaeon ex4484_204]